MLARPSAADDALAVWRARARAAAGEPGTAESVLVALPRPIAVVGNATPARPWGVAIDRYATVIRLNNFRTAGFEALVGGTTSLWVTSGWEDIEPRPVARVVSPFTAAAPESLHAAAFAARHGQAICHAATDVTRLPDAIAKPSTGLALARLLDLLDVPADLFGFDGFRTTHYWAAPGTPSTTHASQEIAALAALPGLAVHGWIETTHPWATAWPPQALAQVAGAVRRAVPGIPSPRVRLVGVGMTPLAQALRGIGARVLTMDVAADGAGAGRGAVEACLHALALAEPGCDVCVVAGLLDQLSPNERRVVVRQAARLSPMLVATVRASARAAAEGHARRLPVMASLFADFDVDAAGDAAAEDVVIVGRRLALPRGVPATPVIAASADVTSGAYHLPAAYVSRPVPEYYADIDRGTTWQPDVYRLVRDLGRELGLARVIDIGCGQGRKVAALAPEFDVVGLDVGPNLAHCRATYPWGRWIETNLELDAPPPVADAELAASVVVASDVIEHLVRPEVLLARIRRMLDAAPIAVLTTPERALTHGAAHLGPPPNAAHVREWTLDELRAFAASAGLRVAYAGVTASESDTWARKTSMLVLTGAADAAAQHQHLAARADALLALYDRERGGGPSPSAGGGPRAAMASGPSGGAADAVASDVISIVMRTKDRPVLLERAVRSVVAQTWPAWQLVIVNDAGDRAAVEAVVAATVPRDPRVVVVHRPESVGMEAATNAGLAAATGRYVTILDDDDSWEPAFLATCAAHLAQPRPERVRGVVTHSTRIVERLSAGGMEEVAREAFTPDLRGVSLALLTQRNQFPVNAFVYERAALAVVGGYREDLPVLGDWDFNLRFVRAFDVDVLPLALANYHVRPETATGTCANSPHALHLAYETRVRNDLLRADLDAGRVGLGLLASLRALLVDHDAMLRHTDALGREQAALAAHEAARQQQVAEELARLAARARALHQPMAASIARRLRRAGARRVAIVGTGELADLTAAAAAAEGLAVCAVGDNNTARHGQAWRDLVITSIEEAVAADVDAVALTSVAHAAVLGAQVRRLCRTRGLRRRLAAPRF